MDHATKATKATIVTIPDRQVAPEATSQNFGEVVVIAIDHLAANVAVSGSAEVDLRVAVLRSLLYLAVGHQNFLASEGTDSEVVPSCPVTRTIVAVVLDNVRGVAFHTNFAGCKGVAEAGDLTHLLLGSNHSGEEGPYSNSTGSDNSDPSCN